MNDQYRPGKYSQRRERWQAAQSALYGFDRARGVWTRERTQTLHTAVHGGADATVDRLASAGVAFVVLLAARVVEWPHEVGNLADLDRLLT